METIKLVDTRQVGTHVVEIYDMGAARSRNGKTIPQFVGKIDDEWDWTERLTIADVVRALTARITPDPIPQPTPTRRGPRHGDQAGGYIAGAFGRTSAASRRGECHYCGQALNRRGECDECQ